MVFRAGKKNEKSHFFFRVFFSDFASNMTSLLSEGGQTEKRFAGSRFNDRHQLSTPPLSMMHCFGLIPQLYQQQ